MSRTYENEDVHEEGGGLQHVAVAGKAVTGCHFQTEVCLRVGAGCLGVSAFIGCLKGRASAPLAFVNSLPQSLAPILLEESTSNGYKIPTCALGASN